MFHVKLVQMSARAYPRRMMQCDVLVVGGGHAGCEAAAAAARMGANTILLTMSHATVGAMSCNPAVGGVGKGQLVREVDALDGLIGRAADKAAIHYRMLNRSKGKAVQGPRVQADRAAYRTAVQSTLADQDRLEIVEGAAASLVIDSANSVAGMRLEDGRTIEARAMVLATGTFLNAVMHCGAQQVAGGRIGDSSASALGAQLRVAGLPIARLKTGTPPRLDGRTIDWSRLDRQPSDEDEWTMSPLGARTLPQLSCAITRTNRASHRIITDAIDQSPLYTGAIAAAGPRYCPSIEDKVVRFGDREGHQIFLEPEGLGDAVIYPNGISTSMPAPVQLAFLRTIAGLERVEAVQWGYAVEYDYLDPRALDHHLQSRALPGLFCAGQVNGTTGYEEAAAQGLLAGANAAARAIGKPLVRLDRSESYIGVMVDDLVLQGVSEPYRMLTARAEHRLHLRADNAPTRLTGQGIAMGCVGTERTAHWQARATVLDELRQTIFTSGDASLAAKVRRDRLGATALRSLLVGAVTATDEMLDELIEDAIYEPYVARQRAEIASRSAGAKMKIRSTVEYRQIAGLSNEMIQRLDAARPETLHDAERIPGITPAALAALMVHNAARERY